MIRLIDWIAAFIVSNFILTFLLIGFNSEGVFGPIACGAMAGLLFRVWDDVYCTIRVNMESRR